MEIYFWQCYSCEIHYYTNYFNTPYRWPIYVYATFFPCSWQSFAAVLENESNILPSILSLITMIGDFHRQVDTQTFLWLTRFHVECYMLFATATFPFINNSLENAIAVCLQRLKVKIVTRTPSASQPGNEAASNRSRFRNIVVVPSQYSSFSFNSTPVALM